jgi:predicted nucleotidyltransferase
MDLGHLSSRRLGNSDGYRLRQGLSSEVVKKIFEAEAELEQMARSMLEDSTADDVTVMMFGSAARGEQTPRSDLDVLIVASTRAKALRVAENASNRLDGVGSFHPNILALSQAEVRRRRNEPWIHNALREGQLLSGPKLEAWF